MATIYVLYYYCFMYMTKDHDVNLLAGKTGPLRSFVRSLASLKK